MELGAKLKYVSEAIGFYIALLLCQVGGELVIMALNSQALVGIADQTAMMEAMFDILGRNTYRVVLATYGLLAIHLLKKSRQTGGSLILMDGLDQKLPLGKSLSAALLGAAGCVWSGILVALIPRGDTPFEIFVSRSAETMTLTAEPLWLQIAASVLAAAFFEELVFRGLIYSRFRMAMHPYAALLCQAIVFASMHADGVQSAYAFVLALMLGFAVWKTGSLRSAVIMHAAFNLVTFGMDPAYEQIFQNPSNVQTVLAASAALLSLSALLLLRTPKENRGE